MVPCLLVLQADLVLPTAQYLEPIRGLEIRLKAPLRIVCVPSPDPKVQLAARLLKGEFEKRHSIDVHVVEASVGDDEAVRSIRLAERAPWLDRKDEEALAPERFGQGYVLKTTDDRTVWIVGRPQGILYGATTLLQWATPSGIFPGVHIRDFPDFRYRAAAKWVMNGEANRWSLDRGEGEGVLEALCRKKLDQCLKYKINMIFFDGFGAGLRQRPTGYAGLMRRLNAAARERGIHLVFGTYGAGYGMAFQKGPLYESAPYLGEAFRNRASYPGGPVYACTGETRAHVVRMDVDPRTLGTCRSNEDLNRLKAEELREFVAAVQPGALYIHHEDYGSCETTGAAWKIRCERCRARWPNDDVASKDGCAGSVANGYAALIRGVWEVQAQGYDAARDCLILLTSPVYQPTDWSLTLRFWQNVGGALPPEVAATAMPVFRETFPDANGRRWIETFLGAMEEAGLKFRPLVFLASGGDHWLNDYPLVATPMLNAHFLGAQAIFNCSGDAYREPQQLLNAEYSWNARRGGMRGGAFKDPKTRDEARELWRALANGRLEPDEIFGAFLNRACEKLYGPGGAAMAAYFRESRALPAPVPMMWDRVNAIPSHWRCLAAESSAWSPTMVNESYLERMRALKIDSRAELHRRLKRYWELKLEMAEKAQAHLGTALRADVARNEDITFLMNSVEATVPLARALIDFQAFKEKPEPGLLERSRASVDEALRRAREFFPHPPVDPAGGEIGALLRSVERLRDELRP